MPVHDIGRITWMEQDCDITMFYIGFLFWLLL